VYDIKLLLQDVFLTPKMPKLIKLTSLLYSTFVLLILMSCSNTDAPKDYVARVYDKYLFQSDIISIVPYGTSPEDSVVIVHEYIEYWIKNMLTLKKAELNLTEDLLDVEQQLEDYRTSLIVYNYERELLRQKLDTSVTNEEIENFYKENERNFQLRSNIIRLKYIKIPSKTPSLDKVRKWYKSEKEEDLEKLRKFALMYANNYLLEDENWLVFDEVLKEIPLSNYSLDDFNRNKRYFEINDGQYIYFVVVKGFMMKESRSPLSFEKDNIRNIILNQRKQSLIEEMQQDIYNDAINNKEVEIRE
jgi:hypothetical protein